MKIISKYKDYYDYLSGVYGEDPKLILDRRECQIYDLPTKSEKILLYIAGFIVEGFVRNGKVYYGEELRSLEIKNDRTTAFERKWHSGRSYGIANEQAFVTPIDDEKDGLWVNTITRKDINELNKKENCPIILVKPDRRENIILARYPKLDILQLGSFINPFEMYQMIQTWLSQRVDELENTEMILTNVQKLENKGFDKKTSFRPNMK